MRHVSKIGILVFAVAVVTFSWPAAADDGSPAKNGSKERWWDVFLGAGGGYEYFRLQSVEGQKILTNSVNATIDNQKGTVKIEPRDTRGHGGLWRVYAGIRLAIFGLALDYRQSYIQGPISSWGQLMLDGWFFIPIPVVKPFFKLGVGFVHLKVRDADVELAGTISHRDGDLLKGLGLRGGAGLLIKPIRWFSFGATFEVTGTYFKEGNDATWGYALDFTGHLTFHL